MQDDKLLHELKVIEANQRAALKGTQDAIRLLQPKKESKKGIKPEIMADLRRQQAKQYRKAS